MRAFAFLSENTCDLFCAMVELVYPGKEVVVKVLGDDYGPSEWCAFVEVKDHCIMSLFERMAIQAINRQLLDGTLPFGGN